MISRQKIAARVDKLVKEKALTDDQLLHLFYILSREDQVKITRDQTRRLFRLEKYSEETIGRIVHFLDVVELQKQAAVKAPVVVKPPIDQGRPIEDMSKRARTTRRRNETRPSVETLPEIPPPHGAVLADDAEVENNSMMAGWLVEQTKRSKQAKKIDPQLCCPTLTSALTTDNRQLSSRKRRKKTSRKKTAAVVVLSEEESDEPAEDALDEPEPDGEPEEVGYADVGEAGEAGDVGDAGAGDDAVEDAVDDGGEEDEDDDVDQEDAEASVHSHVESESDNDDEDS